MRDAEATESGDAQGGPAPGSALGRLLRAVVERWPRRLRPGLPRITRWRLAVLGIVALLVLLWGAIAVSSTSMYSADVMFIERRSIGIPPLEGDLHFGEVPRGLAMHRTVKLENDGKLDTYILVFSWGGIRDFLSVDDAFFNLSPGEEHTVDFGVTAPYNVTDGEKHSGRVFIVRLPWWSPW